MCVCVGYFQAKSHISLIASVWWVQNRIFSPYDSNAGWKGHCFKKHESTANSITSLSLKINICAQFLKGNIQCSLLPGNLSVIKAQGAVKKKSQMTCVASILLKPLTSQWGCMELFKVQVSSQILFIRRHWLWSLKSANGLFSASFIQLLKKLDCRTDCNHRGRHSRQKDALLPL